MAIVGGDSVVRGEGTPADFNTVAIGRYEGPQKRIRIFCTGSMISSRHVLTARHCTANRESEEMVVVFGHNHLDGVNSPSLAVKNKFEYPGEHWEMEFPNRDIAILELKGEMPSSYSALRPARLQDLPQRGDEIMIAGFGNQSASPHGPILVGENRRLGTVVNEYLHSTFFRHLLFLESPLGTGACHGDSGGPAYHLIEREEGGTEWVIAGVTNGLDLAITTGSMQDTGDPDFPFIARCDQGEVLYGFTGAYGPWIEQVTGIDFGMAPYERTPLKISSFVELCETSYPEDSHWGTLRSMALKVLDQRSEGESERDILGNCTRLEELVSEQKAFSFDKNDYLGSLLPLIYLGNLEELSFNEVPLVDIDFSALSEFGAQLNLKSLSITRGEVEDLRPLLPLARALNLKGLTLARNQLSTLEGIDEFDQLETLDISFNQVQNLSGVTALSRLQSLRASVNQLKGGLDLSGLAGLEHLYLQNNELREIKLPATLEYLDLTRNPLAKIEGLSANKALNTLKLAHVTGPMPEIIDEIKELRALKDLDLGNTGLTDLGFISDLNQLESLVFPNNRVRDLAPLSTGEFPNLFRVSMSSNLVEDLRPLSSVNSLRTLWAQGNPLRLEYCPRDYGPNVLQGFCQRQ